ncbi:hypothetical protein Ahy_B08g093642 [Arachis hypogaea]|uniref:Uncharacterized protein n=1 Tax=Arachis hypogaea TaxID=3818 RepID=A0A444Y6P7_ARAHY|nr:hypothetical protein Ahy_B08g093642 [Arachis hypogaea]
MRSPRYGLLLCVVISSSSFLFTTYPNPTTPATTATIITVTTIIVVFSEESVPSTIWSTTTPSSIEDAIDTLDIVEEQSPFDDTSDDDGTADADEEPSFIPLKVSGYFFYYVNGVIKKAFTMSSP